MIHLSSYHSNGLPTVVWSNKVNLIGEKVYKPKIHFCEHCNKPILIYGRLIPCKHVFCFTCATLCLTQQQQQAQPNNSMAFSAAPTPPPLQGPSEPPISNRSPMIQNLSPHHNNTNNNGNSNLPSEKHYHDRRSRSGSINRRNNYNNSKSLDIHRSDSNHSLSHRDSNNGSLMNIDDSASNTTPTTIQQDSASSPLNLNGIDGVQQQTNQISNEIKGCHRCGGRALRVERNTLNSIFVCQVDTCRRTYLSARDLQAHVTHRHSRNKSNNDNAGASSASLVAISSSPYISSSTLMHLNSHNQNNNHRQSTSSTSTINNTSNLNNNNHSPNNHHHRRDRDHHHPPHGKIRDRERERDRDRYHRDRDSYQRDRDRERDSKEYHRQSLQRAAQWAAASAQMLEKGLTR